MPRYTEGKTDRELIGQIGFGEPVQVDFQSQKKVLITGSGSYIGDSFQAYALEHYKKNFRFDTIDMRGSSWKEREFSDYDIVYHVAGIAHADVGKVDEAVKAEYYAVNTELAYAVAAKAKAEGVKEFIFMSSMIVYGESAPYGKKKIIDENTVPKADNFYGDSKLQADVAVRSLADETFKVIVLRPPMIYGKNSKGNYPLLAKLAKKLPFFPNVENERSMLHINNLCEFLCQIMLVEKFKRTSIVLFPQNGEWTQTSEMVKKIAEVNGKKIMLVGGIMKWAVLLGGKIPWKIGQLVNKAFGNNCYSQSISFYEGITYQKVSLKKSIERTEKKEVYEKNRKENKSKALMLASVASMIDLFNRDNIHILIKLGYEVDVVANFKMGSITSQEQVEKYKNELIQQGIRTYHVPIPRSIKKVKEIMVSYKLVKKLADENKYQIVHCHSPIGSVICRLACRKTRKHGTKVIYTAHGFHFFKGAPILNWVLFYPAEWLCSWWTDVLITINTEDYTRAKKKFHAKKTEYIPGVGIDLKKFAANGIDTTEKRKSIGLNDTDKMLLSVGELNQNKNHEIVIRAVAQLKNPNIHYFIAGQGDLKEYLENLAVELGISKQVHLLGYRDDVAELLKLTDLYVFPSRREGLSVALMEAVAACVPVVCSKIRGNTDLIQDKRYHFNFNDVNDVCKCIQRILNDNKNAITDKNYQILKKYSKTNVEKLMRGLYEEVKDTSCA